MLDRQRSSMRALRAKVRVATARAPVKTASLVVVGVLLVAAVVGLWLLGFAAVAAIPPVGLLFLVWATSRVTGWTWLESSRRWFAAPIGLGSALLPLVVPVLVIATYAARVLDWSVQVAFGVLLAVVLGASLMNERDGAQETFDAVLPWRRGAQWPVLLAILTTLAATAAIVLAVALPGRGVYRFGGASALLELAGLVLLAAAFGFRLASFRDDVQARYVVHGLVLTVLLAAIAVFGHGPDVSDVADANESDRREERALLLVLLGGFLAYSAVEGYRQVRGRISEAAPAWVKQARRIGFSLAALSALALVGAFGTALGDARGVPPGELSPSQLPVQRPTEMDDERLAAVFLPALSFHGEESWWPIDATRFVEVSRLFYLNQDIGPLDRLANRHATCMDGTAWACRYLTCETRDGDCADDLVHRDGDVPFVYARVVRVDREASRREHASFLSGPSIDGKRVVIVVQYWLFYAQNRWSAFTPFGYLEQEHEGDWEAVVVGLGRDEPLFVAYSAHCGGSWERWSKVEALARPGADDGARATHPLVAVAKGSHANYLQAWSGRPPDWASCRRLLPGEATWALTYASNVRDLTESGEARWPRHELVGESSPVMSFAGRWGASDVTRLRVASRERELQRGRGPTSPALKELWQRPVSVILCRAAWEGPEISGCKR